MTSQQYAVVVPVKPPARGKSRLVGLDDDRRRALAAAFALDTVTACLACAQVAEVLVVTDDAAFSAQLAALGCTAIPDGVTGDLNASLAQAAAESSRRWPVLQPVAICADLPALVPADLTVALSRVVPGTPCFVADADGIGTTLYTAPLGLFEPRFGVESRAAHLELDATEIEGRLPTLRRDVDDLADLDAARALGLGRHTAALA
ncbi:2-phospho-L-lactate guanylyltransferase [Nocardioides sp. LS1]|uniref:2-phospho-L-lactate guanylyltransferase n=1 Tax=Nocardioides sp. LS1 TaxID=1027620 RepID=UPI000F623851|nr:2-phospho-L-lactate guanylyltransferase [Nocardioides sp. LS1]GCD91950.1 hypothetical protein NLS1_39560 [Nocardioides sp. LS1]